ncbi:MAG TPA: hypothetical protein VIE36_12405 [Methylomirabilota bacterium]|jgi:hypothetical protein
MRSLSLLVALLVGGCALGPPLPPPPTGPIPDLIGTWRGTWGGEPATLLISEQTFHSGYSGIFLGDYQLGGPHRPGIAGVLTSTIRGDFVSARAEGWAGNDATGRVLLLVHSESPAGVQRLTLTRVGADELQGTGDSTFNWGPRGPARLTRQTR